MSLPRQGVLFVLMGGVQLTVDSLAFLVLTWAGLPVAISNLIARAGAAGLGFWLNGRFTFARGSMGRLGTRRFIRFILLWCALTVLSTLLLSDLAESFGLEWAWLAKPLIEAILALVSFVLQRHWVYR